MTNYVVVDRAFLIALTAVQIAALPGTVRYAAITSQAYGPTSSGQYLVELHPGDIITDASTIATIQSVLLDSPNYPAASPPFLNRTA